MSLINVAPSLPLKLASVRVQTSPSRLEVRAKPTGLLGFLVQLLGGGEDARLVADRTSVTIEDRTLLGRRRVHFSTDALDGALLSRTTRLLNVLVAMGLALPWFGSLVAIMNSPESPTVVMFGVFSVLLAIILLRPLKTEFGVLAGGVFHGLSMQFKSSEVEKLQGVMTCLESLMTGSESSSRPFDFTVDEPAGGRPTDAYNGGEADFEDFDWGDNAADSFEPPTAAPQPKEPAAAPARHSAACPSCGRTLTSKTPLAGKRVRCPGCQQAVRL